MGILGKFRGGKPDYPPLDSSAPAAKYLDSVRPPLEKLAHDTKDPLEIVPAEDSVNIAFEQCERGGRTSCWLNLPIGWTSRTHKKRAALITLPLVI